MEALRIAKGTFTRVSPFQFFERGGPPLGWLVVRHSHVASTADRRRTHGRWVLVTSDKGKIFRVLRYSVNLPAAQIVMDWAGWIDLQGRSDDETPELQLVITTVRWWQFFTIPFKHVDPAYRLATWIAAISLFLGIVSLVVSFYPIVQTSGINWARVLPTPTRSQIDAIKIAPIENPSDGNEIVPEGADLNSLNNGAISAK